MVKIIDLLNLIRYKNLLIVALTQYLIRYSLIIPFLDYSILNNFDFFLLVISTLFIASAGNIINDYYDIKVDKLNRRNIIIGESVERGTSRILYVSLNLVGVIIGFYLSFKINFWSLGFINVFAVISLFLYSIYFKQRYLFGNLLISFLSSLVLLIIAFYELLPKQSYNNNSLLVFQIIFVYSLFAFITSFIREIIKDLEDLEGDKAMNYTTFAIINGVKKTKNILIIASLFILIGISYVLYIQISFNIYCFLYVLLFIEIPIIYFMLRLKKSQTKIEFNFLSKLIKLIMLFGIMSMLVFLLLMK